MPKFSFSQGNLAIDSDYLRKFANQSRVDAGEENNEVLGDEIGDALVGRGEELGFPRGGQRPQDSVPSLDAIPLPRSIWWRDTASDDANVVPQLA
jgi:hypothetical protein